jgi:predicted DNA-binding protein (MmcQ/YjbR family)
MNIDFLRKFCLALPAATEDVKWGNDLVFSIGGKMFCVAGLETPFKCSFKVADEEYEELSVREGFMPAPYMARAKWVLVTDAGKLQKKEWENYIRQSYELVSQKLPKKERVALGLIK